jgi:hypothetical protein
VGLSFRLVLERTFARAIAFDISGWRCDFCNLVMFNDAIVLTCKLYLWMCVPKRYGPVMNDDDDDDDDATSAWEKIVLWD